MRYLALIHADESRWETLPEAEREAVRGRYRVFADEARAAGKLLEGYELGATPTATTVRVQDGETVVTDGPFAELREAVAGYFVLDCDSVDEAVALAARIPGAADGAVELRPAYVEEEAS